MKKILSTLLPSSTATWDLKKIKNKKSVAGVAGSVIEARHLTACSRMTPRAANA